MAESIHAGVVHDLEADEVSDETGFCQTCHNAYDRGYTNSREQENK